MTMHWRDILDLQHDAVTVDEVTARHRMLAKKHHPDLGGSTEMMIEINAAKTAAIDELTGKNLTDSAVFTGFGAPIKRPRRPRRRKGKTR